MTFLYVKTYPRYTQERPCTVKTYQIINPVKIYLRFLQILVLKMP